MYTNGHGQMAMVKPQREAKSSYEGVSIYKWQWSNGNGETPAGSKIMSWWMAKSRFGCTATEKVTF